MVVSSPVKNGGEWGIGFSKHVRVAAGSVQASASQNMKHSISENVTWYMKIS